MEKNLTDGFITTCINFEHSSNSIYQPQFISNDYQKGEKVLSFLENELQDCQEFIFCVAFITKSGLAPLLQIFKILKEKNVRGKILTTDYLTFSEPEALKKLDTFSNIEVRINMTNEKSAGFHTKGYIFKNNDLVKTIIGSSNLTQKALTENKEWNMRFVSTENGEMTKKIFAEFCALWEESKPLSEVIDTYEKMYADHKLIRQSNEMIIQPQTTLLPNSMQKEFIGNLKQLRQEGAKRALLISATGTGKTYAAAFALHDEMPKRALFIVHREQIAKQAMKSFQKIFGDKKSFGLLSGNIADINKDYIFATMQMLAKEHVREQFSSQEFATIIIDEVHRAGIVLELRAIRAL